VLDKLTRTGRMIVELERAAWDLENDAIVEEATHDDLLEKVRRSCAELPDNVLNFDDKLQRLRR
jgi:hypothetical protein